MRCSILPVATLISIILSSTIIPATLIIPDDYRTIQAGIDATENGDTILVRPGRYRENIHFSYKSIVVIGNPEDPREVIIDGNETSSVVIFQNTIYSLAELNGFTLINGNGVQLGRGGFGGGIYCDNSSLRLLNLIITGNSASYLGGGIFCDHNSNPLIKNVIITHNSADYGGGIFCGSSSPSLENVIISHNTASRYGGGIDLHWPCRSTFKNVVISYNTAPYGAGMLCFADSDLILANTTIANNMASEVGGGIACLRNSDPIIMNTILWDNSPHQMYIDNYEGADTIVFTHSLVQDGFRGVEVSDRSEFYWLPSNIEDNPLFFDAESNNYYLSRNSPCINTGTALFVWRGDTLLNLSRDDYIGEYPDMGAWEYDPENNVEPEHSISPDRFTLLSNYPNPFNSTTSIRFALQTPQYVVLKILDQSGREVSILRKGWISEGSHTTTFNAGSLVGGLYFLQLEVSGNVKHHQMVLLQ